MTLIIEVNKEDVDFIRKTFAQNSHDYIPTIIRNRFTDSVLSGTPIPDNATVCDIDTIRQEIKHEFHIRQSEYTELCYAIMDVIDRYTKGVKE